MNKKYVTIGDYQELWDSEESLKIVYENPSDAVDRLLLDTYGLKCMNYFGYDVIDESKFALFLLKYPGCIEKISYEYESGNFWIL